MADNEHVVRITADTSGVDSNLERAEGSMNRLQRVTNRVSSAMSRMFREMSQSIQESIDDVTDLGDEFEDLDDAFADFDMNAVNKEIEKTQKQIDKLLARGDKMVALGKVDTEGFRSFQYDLDLAMQKLEDLNSELEGGLSHTVNEIQSEMQAMANAEVPTENYARLESELQSVYDKMEDLRSQQEQLKERFGEANLERFTEVNNAIAEQKDKIKELQSAYDELMSKDSISAAEYNHMTDLMVMIGQSRDELRKYIAERNELAQDRSLADAAAQWQNVNEQIEIATVDIGQYERRLNQMREAGEHMTFGVNTAAYEEAFNAAQQQIAGINQMFADSQSGLEGWFTASL